MSSYPIAKAKEQLSRLIDKALASETVKIIRHSKPVVEPRPSQSVRRMHDRSREILCALITGQELRRFSRFC
ncbi:type II toxin-antitoxin system Phd/YefM family antitoxin [Methylocystis sp. SC2]|uniref:type II toxin-antitoxin system Phd/YefM family antitoxin n=1 Tax=Methylocystis sp. (strain SC2) TaxID=187303 RepID=UPI00027AEFA6|nr:hypothetical protein [Methylocystis sp. SC2]CCJ08826.1 Hypothetical protein BN69_3375 [Methylocystis sp. SC2]